MLLARHFAFDGQITSTGFSDEETMKAILFRGGQLIGLVGTLLIAVSVAARLAGYFWLGNLQTGTLMLAGIGAVSVGCFLLVWSIAERDCG